MKTFLTWVSLAVILVAGVYSCVTMGALPRTYDGTMAVDNVYDLLMDPDSYSDAAMDGAAAAIIRENLDLSHSVNDVTSIVFDFRGYDTMGEAFILITAVAGSIVILHKKKDKKKEEEDKDE